MPTSGELGNYLFLPWLRRGLSTQIARTEGDGSSGGRASLPISIRFNSADSLTAQTPLELYGAGEVTALDSRVVVRTWPAPNASDAESNGWPMVELEQPDLPWRYTPAGAAGDRVRPWLALVVVRSDEIIAQQSAGPQHKLPTVTVNPSALLDLSQAWAWAHVAVSGAADADPATVQQILASDPHRVVARLVSPRRLDPRGSYTACLVPSLKRGLLAGLGQNPDDYSEGSSQHLSADGLTPAWSGDTTPIELPVYYQWSFQTGDGDFESLVRRLHPTALPSSFGARPMNASAPGQGLDGTLTSELGLEGAFMAPGQTSAPLDPAQRDAWLERLQPLINRPAALQRSASPEQILAPPLYGRFHALQATLEPNGQPRWLQELNADPRTRTAAGIGAKVVQGQRQNLMASAWKQVEGVRQINEELRQAQLARESAKRVKAAHFDGAAAEAVLQMASPLLARITASPITIRARLLASPLTTGLLDPAWRKLTRPLGPLGRRLGTPIGRALLRRTNRGELSAAPSPRLPSGMATPARLLASLPPPSRRWWLMLILAIALVIAAAVGFFGGFAIAAVVGLALAGVVMGIAAVRMRAQAATAPLAAALRDGTLTAEQVREVPIPAAFTLREIVRAPSSGTAPAPPLPTAAEAAASAVAFRAAAAELIGQVRQPPIARAPLVPADLTELRGKILAALDPALTIERPLLRRLSVAPALLRQASDALDPVMAAPDFPQPMYQPLRDLSQEWLLPGLAEVPPNSLSVLQGNSRFIEAYLVGLNHEMARVLLFSEYPTDQRGTYFRHFWDTATRLPQSDAPDIPPIHTWPSSAALGQNLDALAGAAPLLLLLRGDLMQRYPATAVSAVRAVRGDNQQLELGSDEKLPLFRGSLSPDISFFAFDLDAAAVRGAATGDPGWFFVLSEPPGEPRFGLEVGEPGLAPPSSLDALSWGHLAADAGGLSRIEYIDLNADLPDLRHVRDAGGLAWHADHGLGPTGATASHLARIGLRRPVRIAVHASEMLLGH